MQNVKLVTYVLTLVSVASVIFLRFFQGLEYSDTNVTILIQLFNIVYLAASALVIFRNMQKRQYMLTVFFSIPYSFFAVSLFLLSLSLSLPEISMTVFHLYVFGAYLLYAGTILREIMMALGIHTEKKQASEPNPADQGD